MSKAPKFNSSVCQHTSHKHILVTKRYSGAKLRPSKRNPTKSKNGTDKLQFPTIPLSVVRLL